MAVTVRVAVPADLEALQGVFRRASLSNAGDRAALEAHPDALLWSGESIAAGGTLVAVGPDGTIAGFASTVPDGDEAELDDLFVDPPRMRQGVARRLIFSVRAAARESGVRSIGVTANPHAMAFYTAVGFVADGSAQTRFGPAPRLRLHC